MSDNRHILHHGNTVDMLSNDLAGVTVKGDLGLVEGLEDVITGLSAGHSLTAETVSHLAALSLDVVTRYCHYRYRHCRYRL